MRTMNVQPPRWQQSRPFRGTVVRYSSEAREFSQISGHLSSVVAPQEIQHKTLASALGRELQAGGKMASRCPAVWTLSTGPDLLKGGLWPSTGL